MADIKERSKSTFNQQADTYDEDIHGQHARTLYPVLLSKLAHIPFQRALDLGCGTGEMMKMLLQVDDQRELYGIDLSEKMLSVAESKLSGKVRLVLGDSEHLPFADNFFDVVYCNDSFHHYPAPEKVIQEVKRVLKPGGTFLIGDCWQPWVGRAIMNFYMRHSREGDVKIYSKEEMISLLSKCFHDISWEQAGHTACVSMGIK